MVNGKCKKCEVELQHSYSEVTTGGLIVIVDKQTQQPLVLNAGDKLCEACSKESDYYYRERI